MIHDRGTLLLIVLQFIFEGLYRFYAVYLIWMLSLKDLFHLFIVFVS